MLLIPEMHAEDQLVMKLLEKKIMPKIMVVDDDIEFLEELKDILTSNNYEVELISCSSLAFNKVCELKPDLVILDLKMKTKNGFQLADELHHSFKTKTIPIIAITGFFTQSEHVLMMKLCGIKSMLFKPIDLNDLLNEIASLLEKASDKEADDGFG